MTPFRLAWLTLRRKPLSTWIAVVAIAIAVASSGILLRLYLLSQSRFASLAPGPQVLVGAKSGGIEMILSALNGEGAVPGYLPLSLFESLRSRQSVNFADGTSQAPSFLKSVAPFVYFAKSGDAKVIGTDATFFQVSSGQRLDFSEGSFSEEPDTVVLGSRIAKETGRRVGDTVAIQGWAEGESAQGPTRELKIAGILKETGAVWDSSLFSNLETAQATLAGIDLSRRSIWGPKVLNYFFIELHPGGEAQLEALINRRTVGQAVFVSKEKERLHDLAGVGQNLGLALTALILVLGGLCVASMLIARYDGMSRQVAVLRALGYEKTFLVAWLFLEGALIGGLACAIGASLDATFFPLLRDSFGPAFPGASVPLYDSASVWIIAMLTIVMAVAFPIWRLGRQSLHQSLRG